MIRYLQIALAIIVAATAFASQPLETETARLLPKGVLRLEGTAEFQTSSEGTERAFPLAVTYGITDRTELLIEPVLGTSIRPKHSAHASGPGDLEITLTQLLLPERGGMPAFAVAGEVKIPTANNRLIGTGKTDFAAYAIASRRFGRFDTHANLGYTVVGQPSGTSLSNIINYAIAGDYTVSPKLQLVSEFIGNTSSTGDTAEGSPTPTVPAEAAAAEKIGLVGMRYTIRPGLIFALGVSYDNTHALLIRPGITYRFGKH
jgi:hypothetical protein